MEIEQILQQLVQTDLRHEVLLRAVVEVLVAKLDSSGQPLLSVEEVNKRALEIKAAMIEETKKSPIITPGGGLITPNGQ